jgi:hypothetical protein
MTLAGTYFATILLIKFIMEMIGKVYQGLQLRTLTHNTLGAGRMLGIALLDIFSIVAINQRFKDEDNKKGNNDDNGNNQNNNNNGNRLYPNPHSKTQLALQFPSSAPTIEDNRYLYNNKQSTTPITPPPNYHSNINTLESHIFSSPFSPIPRPPASAVTPLRSNTPTFLEGRNNYKPLEGINLRASACTFIPETNDNIASLSDINTDDEMDIATATNIIEDLRLNTVIITEETTTLIQ